MNCLCCDSDELLGHVVLAYDVPLAKRGGGIKVGGVKVTQLDLRAAWEKLVKRPIICQACGTVHHYDVERRELVQEQ